MPPHATIRNWCSPAGLLLILLATPALAQNRRDQQSNVPRPNRQQGQQNRQPRSEERRESRPQQNLNRDAERSAPESQPAQPSHLYPQFQPPSQGHHSGQWLNQQRQKPVDQQRRALESDPAFRRLPRETQREYEQRLQRFNSLPADRQHQVLRRMETWEHLTPQQKQNFLGMTNQFKSLPQDRRRAVHNAIDTLRAMPPDARQRAIQSGRFSQFSPQERQILDDATRLPLASAPQGSQGPAPEAQSSEQDNGQHRYVPRPPH